MTTELPPMSGERRVEEEITRALEEPSRCQRAGAASAKMPSSAYERGPGAWFSGGAVWCNLWRSAWVGLARLGSWRRLGPEPCLVFVQLQALPKTHLARRSRSSLRSGGGLVAGAVAWFGYRCGASMWCCGRFCCMGVLIRPAGCVRGPWSYALQLMQMGKCNSELCKASSAQQHHRHHLRNRAEIREWSATRAVDVIPSQMQIRDQQSNFVISIAPRVSQARPAIALIAQRRTLRCQHRCDLGQRPLQQSASCPLALVDPVTFPTRLEVEGAIRLGSTVAKRVPYIPNLRRGSGLLVAVFGTDRLLSTGIEGRMTRRFPTYAPAS